MEDEQKKIYIDCSLYEGDRDVDIRMRKVKVVKTRKSHPCFLGDHIIDIGIMARYEIALVDGEWGSFYDCCECMDKEMEIYGL